MRCSSRIHSGQFSNRKFESFDPKYKTGTNLVASEKPFRLESFGWCTQQPKFIVAVVLLQNDSHVLAINTQNLVYISKNTFQQAIRNQRVRGVPRPTTFHCFRIFSLFQGIGGRGFMESGRCQGGGVRQASVVFPFTHTHTPHTHTQSQCHCTKRKTWNVKHGHCIPLPPRPQTQEELLSILTILLGQS